MDFLRRVKPRWPDTLRIGVMLDAVWGQLAADSGPSLAD